jgi:hypothetical protein
MSRQIFQKSKNSPATQLRLEIRSNDFLSSFLQEKVWLEEKQRAERRRKEAEAADQGQEDREPQFHEPLWFTKSEDPNTGAVMYVFNHKYSDCKTRQEWSPCPDIY